MGHLNPHFGPGTGTGRPVVPPEAAEPLEQHVSRGKVGNQQVRINIDALLGYLGRNQDAARRALG